MSSSTATAAVRRLSVARADKLQADFLRLDSDNDGSLTVDEVLKGVRSHFSYFKNETPSVTVSSRKVRRAFNKFDPSRKGKLDFKAFCAMVEDIHSNKSNYVTQNVQTYEGSCLGVRKLPYQDEICRLYNNEIVVTLVALVIVANFVVNIVEKEIDPNPNDPKYPDFWNACDMTFNIIFMVELAANMWGYGGPVRSFWKSPWNVFDTVIVTVGFLTMVNALGPPLDQLKLLRAFRVFRLFKRVESLNKIIVALIKSIPGVANAFLVMFIFFCIYAILAVELFRDFGAPGYYTTWDEFGRNISVDAETARGLNVGLEYYGTFMRALFTLFQVMTGESWSEAVARPLLFGFDTSMTTSAVVVGFFFTSFIILMQMVLINVVVAVLLDKFVEKDDGLQAGDDDEEFCEQSELARDPVVNGDAPKGLPAPSKLPPPGLPPGPPSPGSRGVEAKLDRLLENMKTLSETVAECTGTVNQCKAQMNVMQKEIERLKKPVTQSI